MLTLLLCTALGVQADTRLFYQPLNADANLSPAQWRGIWRDSVANGVETLVVQWTRFGNEDFGGAAGWLATALREADGQGLELILGLHYDPDYYRNLASRDDFSYYWHEQLSLGMQQQRELLANWRLPVAGWYLPMELDDWNFRERERRVELRRQLHSFAQQLNRPLHLSAFTGGFLAPQVFAQWLDGLAGTGLEVWWQDGVGTAALTPLVRLAYATALPCRIGIIRESFRQVSQEGQPFLALPSTPATWPPCHPTAVFELRYRPWGKLLYDNQHGASDPLAGRASPLLMRPLPRLPVVSPAPLR
ncbi:DUF4434 domain-containing protein [Pseudomonas dryadis]|uniref:DUF4434 domain-containing protein n=2 Tax=Pseudomonadales TaxID=72274 RepID=A0A4Q9QU43_9GAMM|nr:DUF4434 domain-containing protein [Pseudomonas dryadis]TBV07384.1 DUF4434 domain-containing protein [Pseudomonas dryadis]TBV13432.1 DUF4434 domain-containing protein [Pseudomonas sp. FRB 230]